MTSDSVMTTSGSVTTSGRRRVVVTGAAVVAPSGIGIEEHWRTLLRGELRVRPIEHFDTTGYPVTLAGRVPDFRSEDHVAGPLAVQTDRWSWMSLAAATMAMDDAGYRPHEHDPYASSVFLASGSGGNEFGQREIQALWSRGPRAVGAYQSIAWFYAASTGQISIRDGLKGPSGVVVSEAAGGLDSIGWARRAIRRGTDAVLVGGTESGLSPYAVTCQATSGLLSAASVPRQGYKPFDVAANGHVVGEGGAVLLIEGLDSATARGARRIWGEVAGYAATHDAHHIEQPAPDGRQYARAISLALQDAGVTPDEVDLVIADGAAVPALDATEAAAIHAVFDGRRTRVPVTAPAGFIGRLMAGGSAVDVATALLVLRDGIAPAVGNLDDPVPAYDLDLVREPRPMDAHVVVVAARGHGGFNSCLVVRRTGGGRR